MKKLFLFFVLCVPSLLSAHDFELKGAGGQTIYFNVTNAAKQLVEVTYKGSITSVDTTAYKGEVTLPAQVTYREKTYEVEAIGDAAFRNATGLKGIVMPAGLSRIGDFAFEGCTALERVVFPGNKVAMGEGTFFRCTALRQVSLGSDWTEVNLKTFRWSKQLKQLFLPAKLEKLQNLKALISLETIEADRNNTHFATIGGALYTRDTTILLGLPRAFKGSLRLPEGVKTVRWGAISDCPLVTEVDLPSTLSALSFREFERLSSLTKITMRRATPLLNAMNEKDTVLLFKVAVPQVKLFVPKASVEAYKQALAKVAGPYQEITLGLGTTTRLPYEVKSSNLLLPENIIGDKTLVSGPQTKSKKK